uniref:exosome complex component RRP42 n=1 Tax=Myxine glutinosa TaxID=7769 RepID=UPI00358FBF87
MCSVVTCIFSVINLRSQTMKCGSPVTPYKESEVMRVLGSCIARRLRKGSFRVTFFFLVRQLKFCPRLFHHSIMSSILLSDAERAYIAHGVQAGVRCDGRAHVDYRQLELELDVVSNTNGSSRVRLGSSDVLVGVKVEMGTPKPDSPSEGYVEFFVSCSANATLEFDGRGGDELATMITNSLYCAFNNPSCLPRQTVCIVPGKHCWILYVDVLILEYGGNMLDTASLAVKAALRNTRIPTVEVAKNEEGIQEVELSDDPFDCMQLDTRNVPCFVTLNKIGKQFVVDATPEEEACCLAKLLLALRSDGTLTAFLKEGTSSLDPESIFEMVQVGQRVGKEMHFALDDSLTNQENVSCKDRIGFLG